uniref:C-type lectin domain-containing protein n=1 Tax=Canis lupus familiaris TaxID=9615 RepID=A0A8C0QRR6_CANLF
MEPAQAAAGGDRAGAAFPMEPLGRQVPGPEPPQVPAEERRPESPESSPSPARAARQAAGAAQDLSGGKQVPSPRPARLRLPPPGLGYGAFRRQASAGSEPPSPGPAAAEQSRAGEAPGPQPVPGEPPGAWAPVELQVDVRVKSVGAAGGSRAPSPAPSTRFLTVPVPESPACPRRAFPAPPLLQRPPARPERGPDAEPPGAPQGRGRCREPGPRGKEDAALLPGADEKLPRAVELVGLPVYMKSLRWALAVMAVFLAVSAVAIVALASRAGARCQPCPQGWMWSEEHCYYLSTEAQAWEASQAFCSTHHATLPLLSHTQDFLSRYPVSKHSWVGARRGRHGWHWIDGAPVSPQLLPEDDEDRLDPQCGGLEEGKLVALDCASPRPWAPDTQQCQECTGERRRRSADDTDAVYSPWHRATPKVTTPGPPPHAPGRGVKVWMAVGGEAQRAAVAHSCPVLCTAVLSTEITLRKTQWLASVF